MPPESVGPDVLADGGVHRMAGAKKVELVGLAVLKRYWALAAPGSSVQDVHDNPAFFPKGIDLILERQAPVGKITADVKVDTYIGSDRTRKMRGLCNPDSGVLLIETMSQLQYDRARKDVPGWFHTSQADEIHYYYLALLNEASELAPFFTRIRDLSARGESTSAVEEDMIRALQVDRDLLLTYSLKAARTWFESNPEEAFRGY